MKMKNFPFLEGIISGSYKVHESLTLAESRYVFDIALRLIERPQGAPKDTRVHSFYIYKKISIFYVTFWQQNSK